MIDILIQILIQVHLNWNRLDTNYVKLKLNWFISYLNILKYKSEIYNKPIYTSKTEYKFCSLFLDLWITNVNQVKSNTE